MLNNHLISFDIKTIGNGLRMQKEECRLNIWSGCSLSKHTECLPQNRAPDCVTRNVNKTPQLSQETRAIRH